MIATEVGSSIEGTQLDFSTRKFYPVRPRKDETVQCLVYPFRLMIFGKGCIVEELNPKEPICCPTSLLDEGDEIRGERITGFSKKPIAAPTVKAATGTHQASFISAKEFAYAEIEIGLRHLMQKKLK